MRRDGPTMRQAGRLGVVLGLVATVAGAAPASAQEQSQGCFVLCAPSLAVEPTVTIENLFRRHRVQDLATGTVTRADRGTMFEMIVSVGVPTTIPRVGLTFEAIWKPFAGGSSNVFTGASAADVGVTEIRDNPVELEFELNLYVLEAKTTRGWVSAHFDVVDQFSPAKRPDAAGTYTHKLDFELDVTVSPLHRVRTRWVRSLELEASFDYLASGIPRAGDVVPRGGERYLDDASPWSLSLVLVLPVAPLGR